MEITINNSPVHSTAMISYPYGVADSGYSCGYHTGVDIVPRGETENNPLLYSVVTGEVVYINKTITPALGVQAQIRDEQGRYWRYCHMIEGSLEVEVGDIVTTSSVIGRMGSTGNVTGRHLHLELSRTMGWQCGQFINPCDALGIPNLDDLIIKYDGEVPPPPPPPPIVTIKKRKFKWSIYSRKLRNKRKLI